MPNSRSPASSRASAGPLDDALAAHSVTVRAFAAAARAVEDGRWGAPLRPGGWSPGQVAEHVVLAVEALELALSGERQLRPVVSPGWQRLLRWVMLPHILFHRSFPLRSRAPREIRPAAEPPPRDALIDRLLRADTGLRAAAAAGQAKVVHPYFGPIARVRAIRFGAVHVEHHLRQIAR